MKTAQGTGNYRLDRVEMNKASPHVFSEWSAFLERNPSDSPMHNPRWLSQRFGEGKDNPYVYFLYRGECLCGLAPLLIKNWPIKCQLGEIAVARLPVRRLCLLGAPHFPQESTPYEHLLRDLRTRDALFDALYLENVPVDSFLWTFLESSPVVRESFVRYVPESPAPRVLLRLSGNFDNYMGKFSSKHRNTLRRRLRTLERVARGEVRSIRFTRREDVNVFVDQAVEVSRKTYQWNLLGLGLRSREDLRCYLSFLAEHGWLRSYLLVCKGTPCAFVIGYQYGSRYCLDDMGYDPEWREYAVGKILQLEIIKDLFVHNRPDVYDLGEYGVHKEEFATDSYPQGKVFLFRRGIYPTIARAGHWGCRASTTVVSTLLERFGWKNRLKKMIRMWGSRSGR